MPSEEISGAIDHDRGVEEMRAALADRGVRHERPAHGVHPVETETRTYDGVTWWRTRRVARRPECAALPDGGLFASSASVQLTGISRLIRTRRVVHGPYREIMGRVVGGAARRARELEYGQRRTTAVNADSVLRADVPKGDYGNDVVM